MESVNKFSRKRWTEGSNTHTASTKQEIDKERRAGGLLVEQENFNATSNENFVLDF